MLCSRLYRQVEDKTLRPSAPEATKLEQQEALHTAEEPPRKKRKGPKGPNPLSVKKKDSKPACPLHEWHAAGTRATEDLDDGEEGSGADADADADAGASHPLNVAQDTALAGPRGHKRKRRRKTAQTLPENAVLKNATTETDAEST
jgi:U3 small nucleolar RNA-associated protein 23